MCSRGGHLLNEYPIRIVFYWRWNRTSFIGTHAIRKFLHCLLSVVSSFFLRCLWTCPPAKHSIHSNFCFVSCVCTHFFNANIIHTKTMEITLSSSSITQEFLWVTGRCVILSIDRTFLSVDTEINGYISHWIHNKYIWGQPANRCEKWVYRQIAPSVCYLCFHYVLLAARIWENCHFRLCRHIEMCQLGDILSEVIKCNCFCWWKIIKKFPRKITYRKNVLSQKLKYYSVAFGTMFVRQYLIFFINDSDCFYTFLTFLFSHEISVGKQ